MRTRRISYATQEDPPIKRLLIHMIEDFSGSRDLEKLYDQALELEPKRNSFFEAALEVLKITVKFDQERLKLAATHKPLVIIANHPYGVVDGLIICYLTSLIDPNFKILTHATLCQNQQLDKHLLPVDFETNKKAIETNIRTKREALSYLSEGGVVVVFPGGGVATAPKVFDRAKEFAWKPFVGKLIHKAQASVLPIYFPGQNSPLFHLASRVHLNLRMSMYVRETRARMKSVMRPVIGKVTNFDELAPLGRGNELIAELHRKTTELNPRPRKKPLKISQLRAREQR